jgi:hypothetical protein
MALKFVSDQIANNAITATQIAANAVSAAKMDLTGTYNFASGTLQVATPSNASDAANKGYVDAIQAGLHWKDSVRVKTTANMNLSNAVVNNATIDGVTIATGDRVLVASQTTATENGIYIAAASGAAARASDLDANDEFPGAAMFVREGTAGGDTGWVCTNDAVTVGSTNIVFSQFTGGGSLTAGDGVSITGNTVAARLKAGATGGLSFDSGDIKISTSGVTNDMLAGSIGNAKLANNTVTVNSGTGISGGGSIALGGNITLAVGGLTNSEISNTAAIAYTKLALTGAILNADLAGSIADSKLDTIATGNKVSGSAVQLQSNKGIADSSGLGLVLEGSTLSVGANGLKVGDGALGNSQIAANAGIAYTKLTLTGAVVNGDLAGSIADSKLNTITTGNKVSGSAVQLQSNKGLEDATGLGIKLDGNSLSLGAGGLKIKSAGVTFLEMAFQPRKEGFAGNGSTTAFQLSNDIPDADWRDGVIVARNGQFLTQLASGANEVDEYQVASDGSNTTVTFGSAPLAGDVIQVLYFA